MTRTRITLAVGIVILAAALASALVWKHSAPSSILLITVDTLRPDRLGCYGHPTNKTPAIDRLAREGAIFERAYCDTPWTTGSMSSVMTGHYPAQHGLRLPIDKLAPEAVTMAEMLRANGFQTAAIIGSFPLDAVYGLDQGFDTYDDEFSMPMIADPEVKVGHIESRLPDDQAQRAAFVQEKFRNDAYRPDEDVTDAAIHWLDTVRDGRPFLLWVHYFGPHEKLIGNRSILEQEPDIIRAYDPDVEANDHAVGRLLDHLRGAGVLDDTLVIVHADHGQNLGEHDYVGHSMKLDEPSVRIPMIVRYPPRLSGASRRRDIARNIDILPTVLDAAGVRGVQNLEGRSLLPSFFNPAVLLSHAQPTTAYFETYVPTIVFAPLTLPNVGTLLGPVERRGIRTDEWKYVVRSFTGPCTWGAAPMRDALGSWQLTNPTQLDAARCKELGQTELLHESPAGILESVASEPPAVVAKLQSEIERLSARTAGETKFALSPEQVRKLKSLGYLQ